MKILLRGTRGSIPVSSPRMSRYGGDTTCVEVRSASGDRLILGESMAHEIPANCTICFDAHWDHIQSLPHFEPLYNANWRRTQRGPAPNGGSAFAQSLLDVFDKRHFPVPWHRLPQQPIQEFTPGESFTVDTIRVKTCPTVHPGVCVAYRISHFSGAGLPLDTRSIAGFVTCAGRALNIHDVRAIPASEPYSFNDAFDPVAGCHTVSLLPLPFTDEQNRILGVLQLINSTRGGKVQASTLGMVSRAGRMVMLVANSLERARLFRKRDPGRGHAGAHYCPVPPEMGRHRLYRLRPAFCAGRRGSRPLPAFTARLFPGAALKSPGKTLCIVCARTRGAISIPGLWRLL